MGSEMCIRDSCKTSGTLCYNLNEFGYSCGVTFPFGVSFKQADWDERREKLITEAKLDQLKTKEQREQEALLFLTIDNIDINCK